MILNTTQNNNYITTTATIQEKIENVIEYFKKTYKKIEKTFRNKYEILEKFNQSFNEISKILRSDEEFYFHELDCFLEIRSYITYIIGQNCKNENFGHLSWVKYLLNIFKEVIQTKICYLKGEKTLNEYKHALDDYPIKLENFEEYFYSHILIKTDEFDADIERLNERMKC